MKQALEYAAESPRMCKHGACRWFHAFVRGLQCIMHVRLRVPCFPWILRIAIRLGISLFCLGGATDVEPMPARCIANVTALERYGLSASRLPAGYPRVNFPPSIFREYRGAMLTLLGVLLAQALTIAALLAQRRRRRHAEAEAAARGSELARAARFAAAGELSASIAHEIGQPLGAILSNADAAELLVTSQRADVGELQEIGTGGRGGGGAEIRVWLPLVSGRTGIAGATGTHRATLPDVFSTAAASADDLLQPGERHTSRAPSVPRERSSS